MQQIPAGKCNRDLSLVIPSEYIELHLKRHIGTITIVVLGYDVFRMNFTNTVDFDWISVC
jgi:hypothetical protein